MPATRSIMDRTVRLAQARGIDVGAHVGFPDRQGFGRRPMQIDTAELATHGDLPARRARRHRAGGGPSHDAHELSRRARQHGRRRRRAGRPAGPRGGATSTRRSSSAPRAAAPSRARRRNAGCAWQPPSSPTAPTTTKACWCRASCPIRSSRTRPAVLARVRRLLDDGTVVTYSGRTLRDAGCARSCCTATRPAR